MSEAALRAQLNARFRNIAADRGWLVDDVQREFALQQFIGRVFRSDVAEDWVLTGGSALRIRTTEARPTGDADLATRGDIRRVTESLTGALRSRPGEPGGFVFSIKLTRWLGQYSGAFEYRLASKRFANGAIDISTDRPITYEPDLLRPTPVVDLAALSELPYARIYPVCLHLSDKVAAMYQKFGPDGTTPSTRTHDLADIVILSRTAVVDADQLRTAVAQQEHRRGVTIPVPLVLPNPSWRADYPARVRHSGLPPCAPRRRQRTRSSEQLPGTHPAAESDDRYPDMGVGHRPMGRGGNRFRRARPECRSRRTQNPRPHRPQYEPTRQRCRAPRHGVRRADVGTRTLAFEVKS